MVKKEVLSGGIPLRATFISSSGSSGFDNMGLSQEMLDKETRRKIQSKKQKLENKLKEKEHHLALMESYPNDELKGMDEAHY